MALFALQLPWTKSQDNVEARAERKRELEQSVDGDELIRTQALQAEGVLAEQDKFVSTMEADPIRLAQAGEEGYEAALRERTAARMALGRLLIKQSEYRKQHDLDDLRAELAGIELAEKQEAQAELRRQTGVAALEVLAELRRASETYRRYCSLFDEAMSQWPKEADAVMRGLPRLPPGTLSPNGLRSLQGFWSDALMQADSSLLADDDPARVRYEEAVKRSGQPPRIFYPALLWGD